MKNRTFAYCQLSPRGFGNEIEYTVACDTKDQYLKLLDTYCKKNEKVLRITSKQAKKEFVVDSKQVLEILQSTCEGEKWQLKSEIEHEYYDWKAEN